MQGNRILSEAVKQIVIKETHRLCYEPRMLAQVSQERPARFVPGAIQNPVLTVASFKGGPGFAWHAWRAPASTTEGSYIFTLNCT